MRELLNTAYLWLAGIHPLLPWALLVGVPCFVIPWALRSFAPHAWERIPALVDRSVMFVHLPLNGFGAAALAKIAQGIPSTVMGAVAAALALGLDPGVAAKGAFAGAMAPLLHELLKAVPWVPYTGGRFPAAGRALPGGRPKVPMGGSGTALMLLCAGIAWSHLACSHQQPTCTPRSQSVRLQAQCDAQQAVLIAQGACDAAPDVQHCPALQGLRAACAKEQKAWAHQCR